MLVFLITLLHIVVSVFLVLVVLLQTGKRADLAGAFGGGGSQTAFGARGAASFLSKMTTVAAVIFMVTSLALSILSSTPGGSAGSVLEDVEEPAPAESSAPAPEQPATPAPAEPSAPAPSDEAPAQE